MCLLGNIVLTEHDFAIIRIASRNTSMEGLTILQNDRPFCFFLWKGHIIEKMEQCMF